MADIETAGVAERYASALFELARDADSLAAVEEDVTSVRTMLEDSEDLRRLISSPVFSAEEQIRALGAVLDKAEITGLVAKFLKLAARNRRLFAADDMLAAFQKLLADHRGETVAHVTSAEPLSETHLSALKSALADKLKGRTVKLETKVDPSLIGGLVVRVGSQMIDTSVRRRLQGLRAAMLG